MNNSSNDGTPNHAQQSKSNYAPNNPLQADIQAASAAVKAALLQLGLLSRFQRDVRALGVQDYASKPPRDVTNALTQAVKAYNDACNTMEAKIMRAKAALLYEVEGDSQQAQGSIEETQMTNGGDHTEESMHEDKPTVEPYQEQSQGQDSQAEEGLPHPVRAESLINDAEMEDLFGPGTAKTDTSTSTPGTNNTATNVPTSSVQQDIDQSQTTQPSQTMQQSQITSGSQQNVEPMSFTAPLSSSTQLPLEILDTGSQLLPPMDLGETDTSFDFGDSATMSADGSSLPPMNFDFSAMNPDDFNNLLASLGAGSSTGDTGLDTGNDLGQGFNLDTDLSSFLNTDMQSNP